MKLSTTQLTFIGIIFLLLGLIFILTSWINSYPIYFSEIETPTLFQFYPTIWPGITLTILGLFIIGFFSKINILKIICISGIPVILYSYVSFFRYVPTSDAGNVRAMFEIFNALGADSAVEPYFQYPTYFTLNKITHSILGWDVNSIALFFFFVYGILISMFIFIYISNSTNKNSYQLAFIGVFIYFIGVYSFINYQWVPQTLALVFFITLLFLFDKNESRYRILSVMVFTVLVFSHAFIPVMFLIFFGLYSLKKKVQFDLFLLFCWIYSMVLIYHTTAYFPDIIEVFQDSLFGVGEYSALVSRSLKEPIGLISQTVSYVNRIIVPLTWIMVLISFVILFIKKKLRIDKILLGITGVLYLIAGFFFSVLGTRALQIFLIPLVSSIDYYLNHWKKSWIFFIIIILLLCVFLPIRSSYDNYLFQLDEEEKACNFLAYNIPVDQYNHIALSQISGDYVLKKMIYFNRNNEHFKYPLIIRPHKKEFYEIFNATMNERDFLLYNPNLGKHISAYGLEYDTILRLVEENLRNDKIYESGKTRIMVGG